MDKEPILVMLGLLIVMGIMFVGSTWLTEGPQMGQSALAVWVFLVAPIMFVGMFVTQDVDNPKMEEN